MAKAKPKCKQCGSILGITYKGEGVQYPVFTCKEHGSSQNEWEKWWNTYSSRWRDKSYWDKPADKISCIVGYFCSMYEKFYGHSFTLDVSNPIPYKSKTFIMARRMLSMFEGNAHEIRIYIKWVLAKKVKTSKYPITSLGFFANAALINEYKCAKARSKVLKRYTPLPATFLKWCEDNHPQIFEKQELKTWNDLNGLISYIKSYGDDSVEGRVILGAVEQNLLQDQNTFRKLED